MAFDDRCVSRRDQPAPAHDDKPVLPDVTEDERGVGWGDEPDDRRSDEWYEEQRPPHHE